MKNHKNKGKGRKARKLLTLALVGASLYGGCKNLNKIVSQNNIDYGKRFVQDCAIKEMYNTKFGRWAIYHTLGLKGSVRASHLNAEDEREIDPGSEARVSEFRPSKDLSIIIVKHHRGRKNGKNYRDIDFKAYAKKDVFLHDNRYDSWWVYDNGDFSKRESFTSFIEKILSKTASDFYIKEGRVPSWNDEKFDENFRLELIRNAGEDFGELGLRFFKIDERYELYPDGKSKKITARYVGSREIKEPDLDLVTRFRR